MAMAELVDLEEAVDLALKVDLSAVPAGERIEATESALKLRRRELEVVRQRRSEVEVVLAKEEADLHHLSESFESGHGMTIPEAAELLNPADLQRNDDTIVDTPTVDATATANAATATAVRLKLAVMPRAAIRPTGPNTQPATGRTAAA